MAVQYMMTEAVEKGRRTGKYGSLPRMYSFHDQSRSVAKNIEIHPDFGKCVSSLELQPKVLQQFYLVRAIRVKAYQNEDGFTVLSPEFPDIIGYGDTQQEAYEAWSAHLIHLRESFGRLSTTEATGGARLLKERLRGLLLKNNA